MSTKYEDNNNNIEPVCPLSNADRFPCYEILNGNVNGNSINLVCSSSHFVKLEVKNDSNGKTILDKPEGSKVIENFIQKQRMSYYYKLSVEDKEQFENFVSFININHSYGSAISLRILIENFFKENFISPALDKFATEDLRKDIFSECKKKNYETIPFVLHQITFSGLIKTLKNKKPQQRNNPKYNKDLKYRLEILIKTYITVDIEGKKMNLKKKDLNKVNDIFSFVSSVVHGKKYDCNQIFSTSQPFFDILRDFYNKQVNSGDTVE
ncbi:MAG: hypothetical protein QXP07_00035 [Candidatus Parvarchaeum sp.]|nr:hypothetical protein [Candidatus Parvarchaeum tengchongense]